MKKSLVFIFCCLVSGMAFGQTEAGAKMAGINLSFYSVNYSGSDAKNTASNFAPSFGYFFADNVCVGATLAVGTTRSSSPGVSSSSRVFGVGPFFRYYKFTSSSSFAFFAQGAVQFTSRRVDPTTGPDQKSSAISFQVSPGFSYFFTKRWSAELAFRGLEILSENADGTGGADYTQVTFGVDSFSPSLGMRVYF